MTPTHCMVLSMMCTFVSTSCYKRVLLTAANTEQIDMIGRKRN